MIAAARRGLVSYGRRHTRGAFTLVELLVALTVSSIVILGVHAGARAGWDVWRRVEDGRPVEQRARRILGAMRWELGGFYRPRPVEGEMEALVRMEDRDRGELVVSWFTTMPSYRRGLPAGRCARVTYVYRKGEGSKEGGGVLERREQLAAGEKVIGGALVDVLAKDLAGFEVECFDSGGNPVEVGSGGSDKPPRRVKVAMSWSIRDGLTGRAEPVRYAAEFLVPNDGDYLTDDSEEEAES